MEGVPIKILVRATLICYFFCQKSLGGVNSILGGNLPATEISRINVGDQIYTTLSNALKFHFTDIGPRLVNNIPQTNERFEDFIMPSDSSFTPREALCPVVQRLTL